MKQSKKSSNPIITDHEIDPTAGNASAPTPNPQSSSPARRFACRTTDGAVTWQRGGEQVRIEAVADGIVRIRATRGAELTDPWAAYRPALPPPPTATIVEDDDGTSLTLGRLRIAVTAAGRISVERDGVTILQEMSVPRQPPARRWRSRGGGGLERLEWRLEAHDGERFYGLGQHQHGRVDQAGSVIDLLHRNTETAIPVVQSSLGYGMFWNHPGEGRIELGKTMLRWTAEATPQLDVFVWVADNLAGLLERCTHLLGRHGAFPDWATGLWISRCRYRDQAEVERIAAEAQARNWPLAVMLVDFFHSPVQGDWCFDARDWPDPASMVAKLGANDIHVMLSHWPTVSPRSTNHGPFLDQGWLVGTEHGQGQHFFYVDRDDSSCPALGMRYYDPTNPAARAAVWACCRSNYAVHGIRHWWLDACEPAFYPAEPEYLRFRAGNGQVVSNLYPLLNALTFFEGQTADGQEDILNLSRSAWAGQQRLNTIVWSGDIASTWKALGQQIGCGLNMGLSGIAWWSADVGGFDGGNQDDPAYRELLLRWFQFACFSPLLRLHGARWRRPGENWGANEPWSYGPEVEARLRRWLGVRLALQPYLMACFDACTRSGLPIMRPLAMHHGSDPAAWACEDQFLFGPDILVAPVIEAGASSRRIYLPAGTDWVDPLDGRIHVGGQWLSPYVDLDILPLYVQATAASTCALLQEALRQP